jgi:Serine/threonine protein kinase
MAIELLAPECTRSPELVVFQDFLQDENKGLEGYSYTKIWEDELARRFNSTSFVPLIPGEKLNYKKLTVQQQLAFGGFSAVYLVEDEAGSKLVLKESVLPPSSSEQVRAKASELFEREGQILQRLDHEGIARISGSFAESGRRYMLLDYVQGQNLRQLVRLQGPQSLETALQWGLQMCDMLDYLHGQAPPVMHRDFTPDNLVLKENGDLVLVDFGAANEFISTATGTLIGKQCYMPPEQVRGKPVPQSDLYALGATIYFVLTGRDPVALSACRPATVVEVPPELDALIASLTHLEVPKRPQSASEVKTLIAAVLAKIQKEKNLRQSSGSADTISGVASLDGGGDASNGVVPLEGDADTAGGVGSGAQASADAELLEGQSLNTPGKRELA